MSIHPTSTNEEVTFICNSIRELAENIESWKNEYQYNARTNEFVNRLDRKYEKELVKNWFK